MVLVNLHFGPKIGVAAPYSPVGGRGPGPHQRFDQGT